MAVTENQIIKRKSGGQLRGVVAKNENLYGGTLCFRDSNGHATGDDNGGSNPFLGVVDAQIDNSAGSAGGLSGDVWGEGTVVLLPLGSATQADVAKKIYASDNYTTSLTSSTRTYIGTISEFESTTHVWVLLDCQLP
jgi:hypothetical protein